MGKMPKRFFRVMRSRENLSSGEKRAGCADLVGVSAGPSFCARTHPLACGPVVAGPPPGTAVQWVDSGWARLRGGCCSHAAASMHARRAHLGPSASSLYNTSSGLTALWPNRGHSSTPGGEHRGLCMHVVASSTLLELTELLCLGTVTCVGANHAPSGLCLL